MCTAHNINLCKKYMSTKFNNRSHQYDETDIAFLRLDALEKRLDTLEQIVLSGNKHLPSSNYQNSDNAVFSELMLTLQDIKRQIGEQKNVPPLEQQQQSNKNNLEVGRRRTSAI